MHIDLVRRFNFFVILMAFVCLLMLLHTIRRVEIPLSRVIQEFNSYCKSMNSNRPPWSDYRTSLAQTIETDSNDFTRGVYVRSLSNTDDKSGDQGYDSFTEVLQDNRMNKVAKRSTLNKLPGESPYRSFRTEHDGKLPWEAYYDGLRTTRDIQGPTEAYFEGLKTKTKVAERDHYEGLKTTNDEEDSEKRDKTAAERYLTEYRDSQPLSYRKYGDNWLMTVDELSFLRSWCIQRDYRVNWKRVLGPCKNSTEWSARKPYWTTSTVTKADLSYVVDTEVKPVGQFSKFFIQSVSQDGTKKTYGGDSWRVHISGASSIPVTIVDHNDGKYEVLFLVLESGQYSASIVLDYTLCDGFKDPPKDWFIKGNSQGKYQHPDALPGYERPYLLQTLPGGLNFTVSSSSVSVMEEMSKNGILETYCPNPSCMMADGFGRWANDIWKPYLEEHIERDSTDHKDGWLWIYGDSVGDLFYKSISKRPLCNDLMAGCDHTYNWVYKIQENNISQAKMLWDTNDFSMDRVISELDNSLSDPKMNDHSVVVINMGLHYVQGISFLKYQRLIQRTIDLINSHSHSPHGFHGKVIWKTTTALFKERYGDPKSGARHAKGLRFLTVPRVQLYNAYATSAMCSNGISVLDVYPISDSYPAGTGGVTSKKWDAVHFRSECFKSTEDTLEEYLG